MEADNNGRKEIDAATWRPMFFLILLARADCWNFVEIITFQSLRCFNVTAGERPRRGPGNQIYLIANPATTYHE